MSPKETIPWLKTPPRDATYTKVASHQKSLKQSMANLSSKQRLYLSLGFLAFSSLGVFATYQLEKAFPPPKPTLQPHLKGAKSRVDLLVGQDDELKKREGELLEKMA